jgi:membrane-associated protein
MDIGSLLKQVLHPDELLTTITTQYGAYVYAILATIIFCETGLVVTAFLPGDSLLFATGALAVRDGSGLSVLPLGALLIAAAIVGDTVNYHIGKAIGPRVMRGDSKSRFLKKEYLDKTHAFFEKYGGKAIILARFVPIVRTFAPFVAGAGAMSYGRFIAYNVIGGIAWVVSMMGAGVLLGNIPFIKKHFDGVVVLIVVVSVLPMVFEWWKSRGKGKAVVSNLDAP